MEAMLGISLHSYPYLNYQNTLSLLLLFILCLQQNWKKGRTVSAWKKGEGAEDGDSGIREGAGGREKK
jgi:hypothetical protein